jgi:hypothetical protein
MTNLVLPDKGDNNWDVEVNNAFFALEDRIDALRGWELVAVPASATATGTLGQVAVDDDFIYLCVSTNVWRKVALTTF